MAKYVALPSWEDDRDTVWEALMSSTCHVPQGLEGTGLCSCLWLSISDNNILLEDQNQFYHFIEYYMKLIKKSWHSIRGFFLFCSKVNIISCCYQKRNKNEQNLQTQQLVTDAVSGYGLGGCSRRRLCWDPRAQLLLRWASLHQWWMRTPWQVGTVTPAAQVPQGGLSGKPQVRGFKAPCWYQSASRWQCWVRPSRCNPCYHARQLGADVGSLSYHGEHFCRKANPWSLIFGLPWTWPTSIPWIYTLTPYALLVIWKTLGKSWLIASSFFRLSGLLVHKLNVQAALSLGSLSNRACSPQLSVSGGSSFLDSTNQG